MCVRVNVPRIATCAVPHNFIMCRTAAGREIETERQKRRDAAHKERQTETQTQRERDRDKAQTEEKTDRDRQSDTERSRHN